MVLTVMAVMRVTGWKDSERCPLRTFFHSWDKRPAVGQTVGKNMYHNTFMFCVAQTNPKSINQPTNQPIQTKPDQIRPDQTQNKCKCLNLRTQMAGNGHQASHGYQNKSLSLCRFRIRHQNDNGYEKYGLQFWQAVHHAGAVVADV